MLIKHNGKLLQKQISTGNKSGYFRFEHMTTDCISSYNVIICLNLTLPQKLYCILQIIQLGIVLSFKKEIYWLQGRGKREIEREGAVGYISKFMARSRVGG